MTPALDPFRLRRHRARRLAAILVFIVLTSCGSSSQPPAEFGSGTLRITTSEGPVILSVRTATTPAAKAQGLMHRTQLPEDEGVAFLSKDPSQVPFWMKDTTIPLSVAFWNPGYRIVDMLDMSPCTSDPCPLYRSSSPYVGAVEVNRGFFQRNGVQVGDRIQLDVPSAS